MEVPTGNNPISYADPPQWCDVGGNRLRLVRVPSVRLAALINLLESAQNSLKLFFYMFEDDRTGRQILDILVAACDRGVKVEMMIDSFGSNGAPRKFFAPLIEAGGKFKVFSPNFSSSYFVRNHQKMIIADDGCALIGGFNIADEYFSVHRQNETGDSTDDSWEDLGLEIAGPEVRNLANYYRLLSDWVYRDTGNQERSGKCQQTRSGLCLFFTGTGPVAPHRENIETGREKPDHIAGRNRQCRDNRGQQTAIWLSVEAPCPHFRISAATTSHETGDRR